MSQIDRATGGVHTCGFSIQNDLAIQLGCVHDPIYVKLRLYPLVYPKTHAKKDRFVYRDGSCLGNPGPGGYGAVMVYGKHRKELAGGFRLTTNNRMELMAAIMGLRTLNEPCQVRLTTDSQYVRQGITQWIIGWKKKGWVTASRQPVKNVDLCAGIGCGSGAPSDRMALGQGALRSPGKRTL